MYVCFQGYASSYLLPLLLHKFDYITPVITKLEQYPDENVFMLHTLDKELWPPKDEVVGLCYYLSFKSKGSDVVTLCLVRHKTLSLSLSLCVCVCVSVCLSLSFIRAIRVIRVIILSFKSPKSDIITFVCVCMCMCVCVSLSLVYFF